MSMISSANVHHLSADEVSVHVVNNTTWVNLGPIAVFGEGASQQGLVHLREIFHKVLLDIDGKIIDNEENG
jgi:hypothetical protein